MLHYLMEQPLYQSNRPDIENFLLRQKQKQNEQNGNSSNAVRIKLGTLKSSICADDNQTKLLELILENGG